MAVSRPLHSGVCETRQDAGLPVLHSEISDRGRLRTRGGQPKRGAGAKEKGTVQSRRRVPAFLGPLPAFARRTLQRRAVAPAPCTAITAASS